MARRNLVTVVSLLLVATIFAGCQSPYHSDRGALGGGLLGAGAGAIVGNAVGNPLAGAAIGAGLGTVTGAAIGQGMDEVEAKNRAMIEAKMGRAVAAGSVTPGEVVAMATAGVDEQLICNHIRAHGMAAMLTSGDLISLKQQGVSPTIIEAMQTSPPKTMVVQQPAVQPVIVEEYHYGVPYWGPPPYRYHPYPPHHPGVSWGVAVGN
jgi:hypothetical protein